MQINQQVFRLEKTEQFRQKIVMRWLCKNTEMHLNSMIKLTINE